MIPIKLLYVNYKGGLQLNGLNWFGPKILKNNNNNNNNNNKINTMEYEAQVMWHK